MRTNTTANQMYDQFCIVMDAFMNSSYKNYNTHSYAAGYLNSTVRQMFNQLSMRDKRDFMSRFVETTSKQIKDYSEKKSENMTFTPSPSRESVTE